MKKWMEATCVLTLVLFSFFYTNEAVKLVQSTNPIMQQIKQESASLEEEAVDAKIEANRLIPGYNGKKVDEEKSFKKMRQYGEYNESLLVFEEVSPTVSMDEYYDKYIASGNELKEKIALVFEVKENDDISLILKVLSQSDARATFFVDGLWLEKNTSVVQEMLREDHEIEVLSYDNGYDEILFQNTLDVLSSITNVEPQYCFAKYDNKQIMDLCSKKKMYTIIPTLQVTTHPFASVKNKVGKGSIIGFEVTNEVNNELAVLINYLKSKGYVLSRLDHLLSEARDEK